MMKQNVANFIIHDLSMKHRAEDVFNVNTHIISDVVEGWNRNIYVVPHQATKFNHRETNKYILM